MATRLVSARQSARDVGHMATRVIRSAPVCRVAARHAAIDIEATVGIQDRLISRVWRPVDPLHLVACIADPLAVGAPALMPHVKNPGPCVIGHLVLEALRSL